MKKGQTKYQERVGCRFDKLVVLDVQSKLAKDGKYIYYFGCKCDCGNIKIILCSSVIRGSTTSCGCRKDQYSKITGENSSQFTGYKEIRGKTLNTIQRRANKRGYTFDLLPEKLWDIFLKQDRKCALSGIDIQFGRSEYNTETTASLDRIDSTKGYVLDNVQWVHKTINLMKNVLSVEDFVMFCKKVAERN